ncbi:ATP-binding protein [Streptomyces sp. NPDC055109]
MYRSVGRAGSVELCHAMSGFPPSLGPHSGSDCMFAACEISAQLDGNASAVPATQVNGHARLPAEHATSSVTAQLESHPEAAREARRIARATLQKWHIHSDKIDNILIILSELVANAIEHANPPLVFHLHRESTGNRVWIGVTDGGPANTGRQTAYRDPDEHGRGLSIIEALADAHGVQPHVQTVTHWVRINV